MMQTASPVQPGHRLAFADPFGVGLDKDKTFSSWGMVSPLNGAAFYLVNLTIGMQTKSVQVSGSTSVFCSHFLTSESGFSALK